MGRSVLRVSTRVFAAPVVGLLYGITYYQIFPIGGTLALNAGLAASAPGVAAEFATERAVVRWGGGGWH
jgi:hypothetical protein